MTRSTPLGRWLILLAATCFITPPAIAETPVTVEHALGTTVIEKRPERVVALDMNELDFLDRLGVPVIGTARDFVPHFLAKYRDDPAVADVGMIVKPNVEKVYALQPDLILMTSLQAEYYAEMSSFAPVIHYDVDYRDSSSGHIRVVKEHFLTLARIFGKEDVAQAEIAGLEAKITGLRALTEARPERALLVLHNNGGFSAFGLHSRYGFVFDAFGVKAANEASETGLHGQPVTSEFIQAVNPDIIYVIDRTAVMERRPVLDAATIENPLLRETAAWKAGKVIFVDPEAWYTTAASITPLEIIISDIRKGYE
ncbi:siderophore ABC transporter substrate-binding protein [Pseudogemmobacter bohemicus]|uniref:siderophore ABC transporter substrate-binding protein n=1 Tax=Pseudogemmobacter bohemicus TaxID=2250708 RepID=UPI000DD2F11A|nr:siderophore ABC transporter substrate-binding protein [Pseudogemmobacter bohemicus]